MAKPGFDLILGSNTMKELGIVLDFWTKEITRDEISLPKSYIKKLKTSATIESAWTMNNIIYQSMSREPQSMFKASERVIQILDAKYKKANLRAIVEDDCNKHLSAPEKTLLLKLLQEFEDLFDGTLGDWDCNPVLLELKEGSTLTMATLSQYPKSTWKPPKRKSKDYVTGDTQMASRFRKSVADFHSTKKGQHSACHQ
jgi:hypothetical protein